MPDGSPADTHAHAPVGDEGERVTADARPARPDLPPPASRDGVAGRPLGAAVLAAGAAVVGAAWAWLWLDRESARLTDLIGQPFGLDVGLVVDFAMLCAGVVLLAWLVGARTALRPALAATVAASAIALWTATAYALLANDLLAAWPGFAGPDHLGARMELAFGPRWVAMAGPVLLAAATGAVAWVAAHARPAPARAAGSRWGSALVGVGVGVAAAVCVALQVAVWPSEVLGPWPPSELAAWPTVTLVLTVAVGWAASGRGSGVVALTVLAAVLLYLGDDMATEFQHLVAIPTGLLAALLATLHRPFARTLAGLLA